MVERDGRDAWVRAWLVMAHVPWAFLVAYLVGFVLVDVDGWSRIGTTFLVTLVWVPLVLHVPLHVGAVRCLRGRGGAGWLRWGPVPLALYAALFVLGGGEALLVSGPFLAAAVFAHLAGRRIRAATTGVLPPLPDPAGDAGA